MAIAPIQGALRRSALLHVGIGISSGLLGGYTFWYGHHMRNVRIRDQWYLDQQASAEHAK
ncbi:hypothetical protein Rhopal_002209-T1 [Rhodotorula paludigena]|uniref:Cytochrome c oxidase polypeptide VIIA n=1 Tax=Rhodotorula paludigena TaxID=86838 RepID=A0AAV5GHE7_9BASI|nr:hypothetical protein Rhopal_002209-T1 [Rhodotorula paludigena]